MKIWNQETPFKYGSFEGQDTPAWYSIFRVEVNGQISFMHYFSDDEDYCMYLEKYFKVNASPMIVDAKEFFD